VQHIGIAQIKI